MGVLAVYGVQDASTLIYYGLHNLQHRGQEGAGIITFDQEGKAYSYRGQGLLSEVFTNGELKKILLKLLLLTLIFFMPFLQKIINYLL